MFDRTHKRLFGSNIHRGIYACVQGPSLETPAEYKYFKTIGADLVGMSTAAEVITAVYLGMRVGALSIVSNVADPDKSIPKTTVEDVIANVNQAGERLRKLVYSVVEELVV